MTKTLNALEYLCYHDKRNPDCTIAYDDELPQLTDECACDNCFYGRTRLAERILELEKGASHDT